MTAGAMAKTASICPTSFSSSTRLFGKGEKKSEREKERERERNDRKI